MGQVKSGSVPSCSTKSHTHFTPCRLTTDNSEWCMLLDTLLFSKRIVVPPTPPLNTHTRALVLLTFLIEQYWDYLSMCSHRFTSFFLVSAEVSMVWFYQKLSNQSSSNGYLRCSWFFSITNQANMNTLIHISQFFSITDQASRNTLIHISLCTYESASLG